MQNNVASMRMRNDMIAADVATCFKMRDCFCEVIPPNASLGLKIISRPGEHVRCNPNVGPAACGRALLQKSLNAISDRIHFPGGHQARVGSVLFPNVP